MNALPVPFSFLTEIMERRVHLPITVELSLLIFLSCGIWEELGLVHSEGVIVRSELLIISHSRAQKEVSVRLMEA